MRTFISALPVLFVLLACTAGRAVSPFDGVRIAGVTAVEREDSIGLVNDQVGLLIRKSDGALLGIWTPQGDNVCAASLKTPLWTFETLQPGAPKPVVTGPDGVKNVACTITGNEETRTLRIIHELDAARVTVEARLAKSASQVSWRIDVETRGKDTSLWSVTFPQFSIAAPDPGSNANEMVVPYRRGQTRAIGTGSPRGDAELPYPGPSAKFQFMAAYGKTSGRGFYYGVEDGAGWTKSFVQRNRPEAGAVALATQHYPENRGAGAKQFRLPYEVTAGPFQGDWWHAARIYREWWVRQVWAGKGLLAERRDIPQWLVHAPIAVRPSTTKPERTLANNVTCLHALGDALDHQPFFGVWYGVQQTPEGARSGNESGHGHLLPPKPGLVEAVHELKQRGVSLQAYIQSMIYDRSIPADEAGAAEHAVTRDQQGAAVLYGSGNLPDSLAMCRATDWWQNRLVKMSRQAVGEFGFSGVYLDSFGKGAPECFAKDHGHPVGGGNSVIAGQRVLAQKVRDAIRAINPEAIMSGEDSIEAFRDLLDVSLYSVNVMKDYAPVYRTVWGDYSLGHARVLAPSGENNLVPELAVLFLEGTIPGRLYAESPKPFLLEPGHAEDLKFFKTLAHYTEHGLNWLRLGEYLHPLNPAAGLPLVTFTESSEKQKVTLPAVIGSVTRSHADGSIAIALVNIGGASHEVRVPVDPALRKLSKSGEQRTAILLRMDEDGKFKQLASGGPAWTQAVKIQPREVVFLVLK